MPRVRNTLGLFPALAAFALFGLISCENSGESAGFVVTATYPHDASAYTQGLVTVGGVLYESTGRYGYSDVRRVRLESGAVEARHALPTSHFGEGLTFHDGRLIQLTWKEGIAYVYVPDNLTPVDSFRYAGEGWGLASDGARLFMSDGSDSIRVLNPGTFAVERSLKVTDGGLPLSQLNELEFFEGNLLANVYGSNRIAVIDPATGAVRRLIDFGSLYTQRSSVADVMNGIAVSPDGGHLLLTGKLWPTVFQVRLEPLN